MRCNRVAKQKDKAQRIRVMVAVPASYVTLHYGQGLVGFVGLSSSSLCPVL